MMYTKTNLLRKVDGMQARKALIGEREFMIKKRFNPLAMSHENWFNMVYPDAKLFLEGLTVENFKQMLDDHRELRTKRNEKNAYLKRVFPDMFQFIDSQRLFFLEESVYKKSRARIKKRSKITAPVLFFNGGEYRIMELVKVQEILAEKKKLKEQELKKERGSW